MNCPRCETATLDEREREGVTIDVCKSCRGLWLDRGELEKLITRTQGEMEQVERSASDYARERRPERDRDSDYDDYRRAEYLALARRHNLVPTGGTDFHGFAAQPGQ